MSQVSFPPLEGHFLNAADAVTLPQAKIVAMTCTHAALKRK